MVKMDKYVVELSRIITELEGLCGITDTMTGGIEEVLNQCGEKFSSLPQGALKDLNFSVGHRILQLSYTKDRLAYYGKRKLDYSNYPMIRETAKALLAFTDKRQVNKNMLNELNTIIIILSGIEVKDPSVTGTLGYRYLRIFLVLVVYGLFCNASIVSRFIIEQLIVEG